MHDGNSNSGVNLLMRYPFRSAMRLQKVLVATPSEKCGTLVAELGLDVALRQFRKGLAALRANLQARAAVQS